MTPKAARPGRVVVLNGGSSAGKTTLARSLQAALAEPWLLLGVDQFIWTLPRDLTEGPDGLSIEDGVITRGRMFTELYSGFRCAVEALARSGVDVLIDEVALDGTADQRLWDDALGGVEVGWVGVRCAPEVAARREASRGTRSPGIARRQSASVHRGMRYDVEVDTGVLGVEAATGVVARWLAARWSIPVSDSARRSTLPALSAWPDGGPVQGPPWER